MEDVLALTGVRPQLVSTLVGHGVWSLAFPPPAGAKFNAVTEGTCVLTVAGQEPVTLRAEDVFLLTRPAEFTLSTAPRAAARPASPYFHGGNRRSAVVGPPAQPVSARLIGGSFVFEGRARQLLLDRLPPLVHLPRHAEGAVAVQRTLERVDREVPEDRFGAQLIAQHLAMIMLVDLLRHLIASGVEGQGWLCGHRPCLPLHARGPLQEDRRPGTAGIPHAMAHRTRRPPADPHRAEVAAIARAVGYGSEAAFGLAFKRVTGQAPGAYRRQARSAAGRP